MDYAVTGDTAVGGGVDYALADGTATILANSLTTTITIPVVDRQQNLANKTIILTLSNPKQRRARREHDLHADHPEFVHDRIRRFGAGEANKSIGIAEAYGELIRPVDPEFVSQLRRYRR